MKYGKDHKKNKKNQKCTLQNQEYGKKTENKENETHKLQDMDMARNLKNVENETQTLFALEYGEKTEKCGK